MQPRWYQQKLMDETKRAWDAGAQNVLVVSPPRSGKTWIAVWLSEPFLQASEHVCIMAHRQELIVQIAMTYAERGHYHNVIAPSDVVSDIIHRQIKQFGKSYVSRNGLVTVGSVDTINARAHKFVQWAARVKLWITDECFVAGTMVGDKPIEQVCVGDKVTSFDEATGEIVEGRVTRTFKSPMPDEMVKVVSSHHVLHVTSGHPFWTKRGWVAAGELTDDDFILTSELEWQRVESVAVLKRGNPEIPGDGFVYNLEVDGYHTYTANGVVVHNCHHLLADNKWGKAIELFTSARGVGFTATPGRADRKSLARSQGGVFDAMAKGVTARQLIDEGYICDYDIIAPPASIDREAIKVGASGEFTQTGLSAAKRDSTITGDCVASYLQYTPGQQAIVFAVDIEHSLELCAAYEAAGVSAFAVSSKTAKAVRKQIMSKFERGVFRVLVNVDLFGEGLNVEGIEVVIMARPTQSYTLYVQQFFRALTRGSDKHKGTIIDHAGNVGYFGKFYGLPDSYNGWTLETEERGRRTKRDPNVVPITTCTRTEPFICAKPYEAIYRACPHCGYAPEPASRGGPEYVAGDLIMLDAETLRLMRGEAEKALWTPNREPSNPAETVMFRNQNAKVEAQRVLRESIALWAGVWHDRGAPDSEIYRRFWFKFGTDILTAQSLGTRDATDLNERIRHDYHHT